MRRWFLVVAVVVLVTGAVPVSAAVEFECDGLVATMVGTEGDDELTGTDDQDVIVGLGGNDVIVAGAGNDVVCGGTGDDEIVGKGGGDVLFGGEGADTLYGNHGRDRLEGGPGDDTLKGGSGDDVPLDGGEGGRSQIRIGAETFAIAMSPNKTKFVGILPRGVSTKTIESQLAKERVTFEILGVDISAKDLKPLASEMVDLASKTAERAR